MELLNTYKDFISYIKYEENLSRNTVKAYERDVRELLMFLEDKGVKTTNALNHLYIRTYVSTLYDRLDKRSIARKTSSIRGYLKFLNSRGFVNSDILSKVTSPKMPKRLMFALSVDEMNAFVSVIDTSTVLGKRNIAIVELLYGAGLRVSELASLKASDIDFDERVVKVLGKGRKQRIVPFNNAAKQRLSEYLSVRLKLVKADKPTNMFFLNKNGSSLNVRSIQRLMNLLSVKSGLLKGATPHTMRHSFATHMLEAGAGIKTVKELLGHSSISATERYTHLTMEKLMEMYKKSHPKGE